MFDPRFTTVLDNIYRLEVTFPCYLLSIGVTAESFLGVPQGIPLFPPCALAV